MNYHYIYTHYAYPELNLLGGKFMDLPPIFRIFGSVCMKLQDWIITEKGSIPGPRNPC